MEFLGIEQYLLFCQSGTRIKMLHKRNRKNTIFSWLSFFPLALRL